jgi:hypothetical protein
MGGPSIRKLGHRLHRGLMLGISNESHERPDRMPLLRGPSSKFQVILAVGPYATASECCFTISAILGLSRLDR